jgi:LDH2 family malate/lactate/ureidoglycolate dehydrogenase
MSPLFELLTSVLVGAPILSSFHSDDPDGRAHRQNALLIALDPAAFGTADGFATAVGSTLDTVKDLPRADETAEVRYPGERSAAVAAQRAANGIPVAAKVWGELRVAAEQLGVPVPTPLTGSGAA